MWSSGRVNKGSGGTAQVPQPQRVGEVGAEEEEG